MYVFPVGFTGPWSQWSRSPDSFHGVSWECLFSAYSATWLKVWLAIFSYSVLPSLYMWPSSSNCFLTFLHALGHRLHSSTTALHQGWNLLVNHKQLLKSFREVLWSLVMRMCGGGVGSDDLFSTCPLELRWERRAAQTQTLIAFIESITLHCLKSVLPGSFFDLQD